MKTGWTKVLQALEAFGDMALFCGQVLATVPKKLPPGTFIPICYRVGVQSVPVVALTGLFIGMVLAVQAHAQFQALGLATQLGHIINVSVVRELGPVLAATMLAGRVGSAIAAELGTMKVTEQIDALTCLGMDPIHYLALPRFLACVLLIPTLTILANFMGVIGGSLICTWIYHIDPYHYWQNARGHISLWDLTTGLIKPLFFGGAIALIACQRGFHSRAGAEGVGKAATSAFVLSFISILVLDFFLGLFLNNLHRFLWPSFTVRAFGPE
ncbi:MAG: ABC transporter permease [Gemmataceae bacterium]|nr:ABC transporter permease [Gemmataceae bacterium]